MALAAVVASEYVDHESGGKGTSGRVQFDRLFQDASRRRFDIVLFWSLDRFSREGLAQTVLYLHRLGAHGVAFHSYTEPHLTTGDELTQDILLGVLSALARFERRRISERTKAGLARARAQGKQIGRPRLPKQVQQQIQELKAADPKRSTLSIAKEVGRSYAAVRSYLQSEEV